MQKNGTIVTINGRSQWTSNDGELPICEVCGSKMGENRMFNWEHFPQSMKDNPFNEYTWQCTSESCRKQYEEMQEKKRQEQLMAEREEKRRVELETLESQPKLILEKYKIPAKYYSASFENFLGGEKYVTACREFVKNPDYSLLIMGTFGCGKTHLAISIMRELFKTSQACSMTFKNIPELLLDIRESFRINDIENTEGAIIEKYSNVRLLVLDDLGAEKTSEFSITTLYTLINMRYNDMQPTIVTTNLTMEQMEKQIHPRIVSRFAEYKIMKINMPDYRKNR